MLNLKAFIMPAIAAAFSMSAAHAADDLTLKDPVYKTLYEQAVKAGESEVVYYTQARTEEAEALSALWAANFPDLQLKIVPKKAPELIALVEAEKAAGRTMGDVITNTQPYIAEIWKKDGRFEPYKVSGFDKLDPKYRDEDGAFYATGAYLLPVAYDPRQFPNKQGLPKTLNDFLDPKFKGKIVMADPATAGNSRTFFLAMNKTGKMDWPFLEKLATQDVLFTRTSPEIVRSIASGERSITLSVSSHNVLTAMAIGQSIDITGVDDGTIITEQPSGILKDAPHPNAAKLLLEILVGAEGEALLSSKANYWPTNPQALSNKALPSIESFNPINVELSDISDEQADAFLKRFAKTFGRE
jgi:iron(III) transport system substrate-binding protein